jgi:hypothetical protein
VVANDLNDDEIDELVEQTAKHSKTGVRTIKGMLKKAAKKQKADEKVQDRERRIAQRNDPRPMLDAPFPNAPWLPEMQAYDEILAQASDYIPPSRHFEGEIVKVQRIEVSGLHAFSTANGPEEEETPDE